MQTLGEQLRRAREAQGMTIEQIEEITLINARHLEAIERGALDTLPRPYIRAFVREYASVVGLDPAEVLSGFDERESERARRATAAPSHTPAAEAPRAEPVATRVLESSTVRIAGAAVVLVVAAVALVLLNERAPTPEVREIPFGAVIREHELRSAPAQAPEGKGGPAAGDSLTLAVVVTDTLWMQIRLDEGAPREYLAPPGFRTSWKARDRFLLTVGNTRAATWTLNGKRLGPLRNTGTVARNIELSRATLAGL
jgi:transcriptional regulator with XRE-family HTH domain